MESRNLGIARALAWERTPDGIELQCVTEGLAAARVALSAVAPRVVRVRVTAGPLGAAKKFSYVIGRPDTGPWSVDAAANRVTLRTAHLVVEASLDPWQLTYRTTDGRLLTHEVPDDANFAGQRFGPRPGFQVESGPNDPARRVLGVVETLLLDPEDHFYGSGERFTRLDLVGRTVRIWNRNSYGARSELAYKNLPLVVGSRGYGIFVDVPTAVTFHLGSASNRAYTVEAAGEELDYYLIAGTPKEIVSAYTELTGRPAVPPEWAFGLWASTCFVQFTTASVLEIARRLRAEGIPCDVFHLDSFWQRALMWCDFEWDSARIPDPKHLLAELHREGFHNCLWINPYVSLQSALYREGATHGYFLRRPDGSVYHPVVWSQRTERGMGLCAIVDFTNPAAAAWYRGKLEAQLAIGADSFKPDFAEEIPDDAVFANGLTGAEMHNPYPLLYQKEVFDATRAHASRVVAWSRSAAPGVQRYPGHWSGDPECTFLDLANTLRGGLAAAMSGLAYWSHDIGGFWGDPSPDLFVRWAQAGFLAGLSRYHGATAREPWRFGDEALRIFRLYARLRSRLVPYLVAYGWQASEDGVPLMRPMVMEFPDDPAGYAFDLQYCLGRELERGLARGPDDAPAPGAAARAAALRSGRQPRHPRARAKPRGRAPGRSAHGRSVRHDRGRVRLARRRRRRRSHVPATGRRGHVRGERGAGHVRPARARRSRDYRGLRRRASASTAGRGEPGSWRDGLDCRRSDRGRQGAGATNRDSLRPADLPRPPRFAEAVRRRPR